MEHRRHELLESKKRTIVVVEKMEKTRLKERVTDDAYDSRWDDVYEKQIG